MDPISSQPSGVPIERGDGRPCGLVDDALSQACDLAIEEVDAHGFLMVDDGVNLDKDHLEWAETDVNDIDEVDSGTFSTPKKVDGLNHHKQSTLFGSALLANETDETFCWVFEQWLTCMHGRASGAIITDMDLAMKNAIKRVFPDTRNRFCEWHIWKHLVEKVVEMRDTDSDFYRDYNRMWEQREHWMRAYWRTTFTAGMKSSQRSESMNSFFDGYVNNNTGLHEFLNAYERALVQRRKTEAEEDFKSKYSIPKMQTNSPLEEEAGKFYTSIIFNKFQDELKGSNNCWYDQLSSEGTVEEYSVGLRSD
ncbi:protein FAR1-RELATED SEQUENCE 5-like [Tasmannia lanceolata]|uniref:protein FAR1-RELATED SEQUENCE 5-like n=1 Tax=Tasmannia lanceolata TaxID=3420 RepID=UPI004063D82B